MKNPIASLTVTPLLYASGGLLLLCLVLSGLLYKRGVTIALQAQQLTSINSQLTSANERVAQFDREARGVIDAQASNQVAIADIRGILKEQQATCRQIGEENRQAVARVELAAEQSAAELRAFNARFKTNTAPGARCAIALKQMEASCSDLSNY